MDLYLFISSTLETQQSLRIIASNDGEILNSEQEKLWMEAVIVYLKIL
jgi:hypothetical protein